MREPAPQKLITCFLPKGKVNGVVVALHREHAVAAVNVTSGRGRALVESVSYGAWVEVDVLEVVVPAARADEIFQTIFELGELGRVHGGLMYQADLAGASRFALPIGLREEAG